MSTTSFQVAGKPVPEGELSAGVTADGRPFVRHSKPAKLGDWRHAIADEARKAMRFAPKHEGAVRLRATFTFERPNSHYLPANSRRPVRVLRDDAPIWHTSKPDVDKLERALLDALTSVAWKDDCQVAQLGASKRWGEWTGVVVEFGEATA